MAKQTVTLHMYESTASYNSGNRYLAECDFRNTEFMKDRIWLGQQDVEIDWPDADTAQLQIEALESQVKQERADSQVRVNLLLERMSKLQAIGHEVAE
jgi:hypothetical protein